MGKSKKHGGKHFMKITRREYGKLCKASERTANRELRGLVEKGIVRRRGSGVSFYYELAS